jgi:hypothetical protein
VHHERALGLTWRLLTGQASEQGKEARVVRSMSEESRASGGEEAIAWLRMDARYADGPLLAWWEYACGIHALVCLPDDRLWAEALRGLAAGDLLAGKTHTDSRYIAGRKQVRQVAVAMAGDLTSWDSFLTAAQAYHLEHPPCGARGSPQLLWPLPPMQRPGAW